MFDFAWSHILLVLVVALVVVGPKDLPRLMRIAGRWVGKARRMADGLRANFDEMARETELDELRKEIAALRNYHPAVQLKNEINRAMQPPAAAAAIPETALTGSAAASAVANGAEGATAPAAPVAAPDLHDDPPAPLPENHAEPLPPGFKPSGP